MISRIKRKPVTTRGEVPAPAFALATAAAPADPPLPLTSRIRPLLMGIEASLKKFNNDVGVATRNNVYLTILRSEDAVEVLMVRNIPGKSQSFPMTLSVICSEVGNTSVLNLTERGPAKNALSERPLKPTLSFSATAADKVTEYVQAAVKAHLLPEEKQALDLRIWPNHYPDAPVPSGPGQKS